MFRGILTPQYLEKMSNSAGALIRHVRELMEWSLLVNKYAVDQHGSLQDMSDEHSEDLKRLHDAEDRWKQTITRLKAAHEKDLTELRRALDRESKAEGAQRALAADKQDLQNLTHLLEMVTSAKRKLDMALQPFRDAAAAASACFKTLADTDASWMLQRSLLPGSRGDPEGALAKAQLLREHERSVLDMIKSGKKLAKEQLTRRRELAESCLKAFKTAMTTLELEKKAILERSGDAAAQFERFCEVVRDHTDPAALNAWPDAKHLEADSLRTFALPTAGDFLKIDVQSRMDYLQRSFAALQSALNKARWSPYGDKESSVTLNTISVR